MKAINPLTPLALFVFLAVGCASQPPQAEPDATVITRRGPDIQVFRGQASFYADSLHGNLTASGEPYDKDELTAAHRSLPFGTQVRVRNVENGKTVVVRINDRGPFVEGRVIDLSRRAAAEIEMLQNGVVNVQVEILDLGTAR